MSMKDVDAISLEKGTIITVILNEITKTISGIKIPNDANELVYNEKVMNAIIDHINANKRDDNTLRLIDEKYVGYLLAILDKQRRYSCLTTDCNLETIVENIKEKYQIKFKYNEIFYDGIVHKIQMIGDSIYYLVHVSNLVS
jgi:hypothetical protein